MSSCMESSCIEMMQQRRILMHDARALHRAPWPLERHVVRTS